MQYKLHPNPIFARENYIILDGYWDFIYKNNQSINDRSEEHTSELQSRPHLVCRLLLEKKNICLRTLEVRLKDIWLLDRGLFSPRTFCQPHDTLLVGMLMVLSTLI